MKGFLFLFSWTRNRIFFLGENKKAVDRWWFFGYSNVVEIPARKGHRREHLLSQ
jgi:hypothetical protein